MADREIRKVDGTVEFKDFTPEEIAEREARAITTEEERVAFEAKLAQEATDKVNAKAKLIAGEALTEAEADTLVL
jgi:hypothetical protein